MYCNGAVKTAMLGYSATNDEAENVLDRVTQNLPIYGHDHLSSATVISNMK